MLKIQSITEENFAPQVQTYLNLNYGPKPSQVLHLQGLSREKQNVHRPFVIITRSPSDLPWPLASFEALCQAGYQLVFLELNGGPLQANFEIKTATRWLLLHAYQYGLDPFRYLLCGLDQVANLAVLTAISSANQQAYSQEDVRVSPLFFRGAIFIGGFSDSEGQKMLKHFELRKVPDLFFFQEENHHPQISAQLLAKKAPSVTVYSLINSKQSSLQLSPYLMTKVKAFCQEAFKKK